jgi:hypothetical protein
MTKKQPASSTRAKPSAKSATHMPHRQIDFSDAPESTEEELVRAKRVGRPKTGLDAAAKKSRSRIPV